MTPVCILSTLLGLILRCRGRPRGRHPAGVALFWLLGIWMVGIVAVPISWSFRDGLGESLPEMLEFIPLAVAYSPVTTFTLSTYDGTLGALLLVSVAVPGVGLYLETSGHLVKASNSI